MHELLLKQQTIAANRLRALEGETIPQGQHIGEDLPTEEWPIARQTGACRQVIPRISEVCPKLLSGDYDQKKLPRQVWNIMLQLEEAGVL